MKIFSKQSKSISYSILEACRAMLFLGALLLVPSSCNNFDFGSDSEEKELPFVDPEPSDFSSDSDDGCEEPPSDNPAGDDPAQDAAGYLEALRLAERMERKIQAVASQKNLRLSQVNLLEKQLADIKKAGKISKAELKKIEAEAERQIEFVLNWNATPTLDIKCRSCKRQMGADKNMLLHMEDNIFGGPWCEADSYGNTIPNSPSYPNLRAYDRAHPNFDACFVNTCVYCYRDKDIAREKNNYESSRQQYESFSQEYRQAARRTNRSANKEKSIKRKLTQQAKNVALYKAAMDAYEEAAKAMEKLRAEAIVDYEAITYGDSHKYRGRRLR